MARASYKNAMVPLQQLRRDPDPSSTCVRSALTSYSTYLPCFGGERQPGRLLPGTEGRNGSMELWGRSGETSAAAIRCTSYVWLAPPGNLTYNYYFRIEVVPDRVPKYVPCTKGVRPGFRGMAVSSVDSVPIHSLLPQSVLRTGGTCQIQTAEITTRPIMPPTCSDVRVPE